jgi:hypothetical protein
MTPPCGVSDHRGVGRAPRTVSAADGAPPTRAADPRRRRIGAVAGTAAEAVSRR